MGDLTKIKHLQISDFQNIKKGVNFQSYFTSIGSGLNNPCGTHLS